ALKPRVSSLSTTVELLTAIMNDIGQDQVFSYQLESLASRGDVLIAISSSGASPNIVHALRKAREMQLTTIAFTGFCGGDAAKLADVSLHVTAQNYGVIEDMHQSIMHMLAQYLRQGHLLEPTSIGSLKF